MAAIPTRKSFVTYEAELKPIPTGLIGLVLGAGYALKNLAMMKKCILVAINVQVLLITATSGQPEIANCKFYFTNALTIIDHYSLILSAFKIPGS